MDRMLAKNKENPYFEIRSWGRGREGGRDDDYYVKGEHDSLEAAYLAVFAYMNGEHYDPNSEYFDPVLDIVEIQPVERKTFQVSLATIHQLAQEANNVEIE
jgi:hypothetical protein